MTASVLLRLAEDLNDESRLGSMLRFFLIALVVVAPFGWWRVRRTLRDHHGEEPPAVTGDPTALLVDGPDGSDDPNDTTATTDASTSADLADLVAEIGRVARAARTSRPPEAAWDLRVPPAPTMGGRPAPPHVVDALLADAARRGDLEIRWNDMADDGSRVATLRPARRA